MDAPNVQHLWARVLVDELARGGALHAVVAPGSRSTPLAMACAEQPGMKTWPVPDERSAAFMALGMAKACGRATLLVCTSGTAGAHFLPAIIEAHLTHVPLVVLTADRPPELHGFGANQSMDQVHLFGRYVSQFVDLGQPEASDVALAHLRAVAARAMFLASPLRGGVVHLNVPFREPLAPAPEPIPTSLSPHVLNGRDDRMPFLRQEPAALGPSGAAVEECWDRFNRAERLVFVCGPGAARDDEAAALLGLASELGAPVIAESTSGVRFSVGGKGVVHHHDAVLRVASVAESLRPNVVVRLGGPLTTRQLQGYVDGSNAFTVLVHPHADVMDPQHKAHLLVQSSVGAFCRALGDVRGQSHAFRDRWLALDAAVESAFSSLDQGALSLTEPSTARAVAAAMPPEGTLMVSSSMPIRDLDAFAVPGPTPFLVEANRGVAGIDGMASTAFGLAAAGRSRVVLLTGDTAFLHDVGGLAWGARLGLDLVVVVVNNDGGRIFSFLPVGQFPAHLERLFTMPHGFELSHAAGLCGAYFHRPGTVAELRDTVRNAALAGGVHVVEVRVDGAATVHEHAVLWDAARRAVESA